MFIEFEGDTLEVEYEGEEGCPATIDSPEILPEFYITSVLINGGERDWGETLQGTMEEKQITALVLAKILDEAKEDEMEKELDKAA